MDNEIITSLGVVEIEDGETLTIRLRSSLGLRYGIKRTEDGVELSVQAGRRPPSIGDEVKIGDTVIEVAGVSMDPDGTVWVTGDNGVQSRWE